MEGLDVDPEAVRAALRDFMNSLANAERERVRHVSLFSFKKDCIFGCMEGLDVDLEAVRAALRDFMNSLANAEHERVRTSCFFFLF
jgi:hypothetical protein